MEEMVGKFNELFWDLTHTPHRPIEEEDHDDQPPHWMAKNSRN